MGEHQTIDDSTPKTAIVPERELTHEERLNAIHLLSGGPLFRACSQASLQKIVKLMKYREYQYGDHLLLEGECSSHFFVIANGNTVRTRTFNEVEHQVDTQSCGTSINSLHSISNEPAYATATCIEEKCGVLALESRLLREYIRSDPFLAEEIIISLTKEIRSKTKSMRTPLFEQHGKPLKMLPIISVSAGIESYYRSALNSMINTRLTGIKSPLFPKMSVQVPTRVLYVNGLKGIRQYVDTKIDPKKYTHPLLVGILASTAPGLIMAPVSSILEASNAGHCNPKPLSTRWMGGYLPRSLREILFGIGLNQLSDFFEERALEYVQNEAIANVCGSISAGVVSGYMSHVPHNLSTLKLLNPNKTYYTLFHEFIHSSVPKFLIPNFSSNIPPMLRTMYIAWIACLFPRGCILRTSQIVGSFIILNATIAILQKTQ